QPKLRHIPVIMISALEDVESVVRCIEMGATDYLPKPFDPVLLRARINASLASKRLRDLELEARRNSPIGRAEARAQALLADQRTALTELHRLADAAGHSSEAAQLLEYLPRVLGV